MVGDFRLGGVEARGGGVGDGGLWWRCKGGGGGLGREVKGVGVARLC